MDGWCDRQVSRYAAGPGTCCLEGLGGPSPSPAAVRMGRTRAFPGRIGLNAEESREDERFQSLFVFISQAWEGVPQSAELPSSA